ncbi:long-chain acyl-CoA synthetase [Acrocarpospora phusangensis]|uniref:Long-chain acyl-CoA synthetase n=1 Tax=Acrocarpospora phusangensis TaxID=1070424 RepID=A0A919UM00_9ACTN|nr:AMP-binding protein [Acrocarpospora phusangensis]GIH26791.1 long-chain acyl-CoA synthetase [Acrocarpospora phusangensis]
MFDYTATPSFYAIARAHPDRRAVVDTDGSEISYGDLLARVNAVSHGLRGRGLTTGDVVAGVLPNGADAVVMLLATGQTGLYYVPINWHLTAPEIDYILSDCDASVVVYDSADVAALAAGQPADDPGDRTNGAVMWYTSGTTGFPKGVQRPLAGKTPEEIMPLYAWFVGEVCDLKPGDAVHLVTSPMYHSAPCAHAIFALNMGHTLVIAPRFEPVTILELIDRYRVDNAMMVPTMFHRMLQLPAEDRKNHDLSSLQQVIHTGAACPIAVKKAIMDWWGPVLYEYYGSTESAIAFAVKPAEWLARPGTVGRPAPLFEARVLDENGVEVPRGEPGLVYIRSAMSTFSYRKDPAKTAASMRDDWYAPGDIASMDEDGYLFLHDRRTDLIVSGGVNIYPAEIEAALLEHPAVGDVAVIGVPDEEWGHRVVALVQPSADVTPDELLEHLRPRLARFKHPRVIEFRDELPRTPTGKLSRSKVRAEYLAEPGE